MSASNYQKVYMNQIHSSSLLCQLAQLWKNQQLCDAIIRTGSVVTKAHRVVLVAACPMLQSMENASFGSHLEVRLAAEIKQDSVNTFLQYLYEGFMMLTEENVRDVEKIAKLLQVENIITCCSDFDKCLRSKQGMGPNAGQYKYNYHDQVEFRHVRTTDLQKTVQERMMKRAAEMSRPSSPGNKRQRMHKTGGQDVSFMGANRMDDSSAMSQGYRGHGVSGSGGGGGSGDTWDRIPQLNQGFQSSRSSSFGQSSTPGMVEIREDSVEIIQTEQLDPSERGQTDPKSLSKSVAISVAGQMNNEYDLQIVNVTAGSGSAETRTTSKTSTGPPSSSSSSSSRAPIAISPLTVHSDSSSSPQVRDSSSYSKLESSREDNRRRSEFHSQSSQNRSDSDIYSPSHPPPRQRMEEKRKPSFPQRSESETYSEDKSRMNESHRQPFPTSMSPAVMSKQYTPVSSQSKPYAVGSVMQTSSPSSASTPMKSSNLERHESSEMPLSKLASSIDKLEQPSSSADMTPDLSIVKIESANHGDDDTGGLDMYVDMPEQGMMQMRQMQDDDIQDDQSDYGEQASGDWGQEDMSNEGSNISGDQSMYMGNVKGAGYKTQLRDVAPCRKIPDTLAYKLDHKLVHYPPGAPARSCAYCKIVGTRTECGRHVRSYYVCETCNVPLCCGKFKDCFDRYHVLIGLGGVQNRSWNNSSSSELKPIMEEQFSADVGPEMNSIMNLSKLMEAKFT